MTKPKIPGAPKAPCRTAARIIKLKSLIAELGRRRMLRDEICSFLKFAPSGARKYIKDLREVGLITLDEIGYGLIDDQARVDSFLAHLDANAKSPSNLGGRPSALAQAQGDSKRKFHVMRDDEYFAVRVRRAPIAPDPLALPREFFAPPVACGDAEPLEVSPPQVKLTGFAALASVRLEPTSEVHA